MINNDLNSKFNPNAKLFSREEEDKILKELGLNKKDQKKTASLAEKMASLEKSKKTENKLSVEEILKQNFIADEEEKE